MGVYIKGIEMPSKKAIAVVIHPDGTAYSAKMFAGVCTEYLADCTAVPVPPHGRLIDADALFPMYADLLDGGDMQPVIPKIVIDTAPTIIEKDIKYED